MIGGVAFAPEKQTMPAAELRRDYDAAAVARLAGSFRIRHTLAEMGANRPRHLLHSEPFVPTVLLY